MARITNLNLELTVSKEWDLNTGQVVRKYPSHGAQISSLSLRPFSHPPSPTPSPTPARIGDENERANRRDVFVSVGPDFYDRRQGSAEPKDNGDGFMGNGVTRTQQADAIASGNVHGDKGINSQGQVNPAESQGDGDVEMEDKASSYDPLFDDDAEREDALASSANATNAMGTPAINDMAPPTPKTRPPSLALPGMSNSQTQTTTNLVIPANSTSLAGVSEPTTAATPLFSIPPTTHAGPSRSGAASNIPLLTKTDFKTISDDVLMTSSMDGQVVLIDRRVPHNPGGNGVGRLSPGDKAPPWCMSVSSLAPATNPLSLSMRADKLRRVGREMATRSSQVDVTGRSTYGMSEVDPPLPRPTCYVPSALPPNRVQSVVWWLCMMVNMSLLPLKTIYGYGTRRSISNRKNQWR